jgi:hypothetical protein
VVLYGYETFSLILRVEYRLRVFKSRVLRRIFGSKRDDVAGAWKASHKRNFVICTLRQVKFNDQVN